MSQEIMGFGGKQWHQMDHMQTICTSLQTDTTPTLQSTEINAYELHMLYATDATVTLVYT